MSSKVAIVTDEIRKSLSAGDPMRHPAHGKPDFRLKRFQDAQGAFGASALCADSGTVYGARGYKD